MARIGGEGWNSPESIELSPSWKIYDLSLLAFHLLFQPWTATVKHIPMYAQKAIFNYKLSLINQNSGHKN